MKAIDRIDIKENSIRYRKVGKKYVPDGDYFALDGLAQGWWLVKVAPNSTSIRACLYPECAEIEAAVRDCADKVEEIIRKASEARPKSIPLSPDEKSDWDWLISRHPNTFNTLEYPSIHENAQKIVEAILDRRK